jgi:neutral amino acid transport system substrate-binding protein
LDKIINIISKLVFMNNLHKKAVLIACVSIALVGGILVSQDDNSSGLGSDKAKIGVALPLTSHVGWIAQPVENIVTLVEAEAESAGGVNGQKLEIIVEDTQGEETEAVNSVQKMINLDEVDGLFGPMLTTASSASVSIVKDNQVPMVAPSTTGTEIANISDDGYFYRTVSSDEIAANALAKLADQRGYENASALVVNDAYGQSYYKRLDESFNGDINPVFFSEGAVTFRSELEQARQHDTEVIFLIGYSESGLKLLRQSYETGVYNEKDWLVGDPILTIDFSEDLGQDENGDHIMNGLTGVRANDSQVGPGYDSFNVQYQKYIGEEPPSSPFFEESYDAFAVLVLAMEASNSLKGSEIRDNIENVAHSGKKVYSIEQGLNLLQEGTDIEYVGASSDIEFDQRGTDISTEYVISTYTNGNITDRPIN